MNETFVFNAMGTVVSVTAAMDGAAKKAIRGVFERWESRFSLFRPDAEGYRVAERTLRLIDASEEFRAVYDLALTWREQTSGAFTPHRPDGAIDLSGIVKSLAIEQCGEILDGASRSGWCVNAGGDVLVRGDDPWVVGIVDPYDRTALLSEFACAGTRRALATSGTAERGEHVWRIGVNSTFHQVSVVASDIVTADVLATAILAGGPGTLADVEQGWEVDVLACSRDGRLWASEAFRVANSSG